MPQTAIFGPFLATMVLTFVVWVYLYARRIPFIVQSRLSPEDMRPDRFMALSPPAVRNPSDNFQNLFEVPVLFYAICLYLFVTGGVDALHVIAGWVFFGFRVLHSAVHCTFNLVILRFYLYLAATLAVWLMIARALIAHLAPGA